MYRFNIKLICLFLPILILFLVANIYVDGGDIIGNRHKTVADIIVSGNNAGIRTIPANWGKLQVSIVEENIKQNKSKPKDILVFGTSGSSELGSKLFINNTFFNCVVAGGNVLDYIALYGLYKQHNMLPKYAIITINFCTFYKRRVETVHGVKYGIADTSIPLKVHKGLESYLDFGLNSISTINNSDKIVIKQPPDYFSDFRNYLELISPTYFQISFKSLLLAQYKQVFITDKETRSSFFVIRKDGSYTLQEERDVNSQRVASSAKLFADIQKGRFFSYDKTNKLYFDCLYELIDTLKKEGVVPIIYFSPINPVVYDNIIKHENNGIEINIKDHCYRNNITVLGSFNPHIYGVDELSNKFIDEYHPVRSLVNNIFRRHTTELNKIGITVSQQD